MRYYIRYIILGMYTLLFCIIWSQESLAEKFPTPVLKKHTLSVYNAPRPIFRPQWQNNYMSLPDILESIESGSSLLNPHSKMHRPSRHTSIATPVYKPTKTSYNGHPVPVFKAMSSDTFIWPVQGKILSRFGEKPGGLRNDGINIAVREGSPVNAIAAGEVIYSGNKLKGYGKLLLIRHQRGWVSAYAHNKDVIVSTGDHVHQGQTISLAGRTGNASTPQLFFALRKSKKAVNPEHYLPRMLSLAR